MNPTLHPTTDTLIAALHARGVHILNGGDEAADPLPAPVLLVGLARHPDARLRLALIALLLARPTLAASVHDALALLDPREQTTLQLYYTAAHALQQQYRATLNELLGAHGALPDLFSATLGLTTEGDVEARLAALAARHREHSGLAANWRGSYDHAAQRLIRRLRQEQRWEAATI